MGLDPKFRAKDGFGKEKDRGGGNGRCFSDTGPATYLDDSALDVIRAGALQKGELQAFAVTRYGNRYIVDVKDQIEFSALRGTSAALAIGPTAYEIETITRILDTELSADQKTEFANVLARVKAKADQVVASLTGSLDAG